MPELPSWRKRWFTTLPGLLRFFRPRLVLPRRCQLAPALALHFGLGLFLLPFWLRDSFWRRTAPKHILFIGRYHLGDFIMLAPALQLARDHLPAARFGLVIQQRYADDLNLAPMADYAISEIDETLPFFNQVKLWRHRFRELSVDGVVFHRFTRPDLSAAVAAILEGIPHRIGSTDKGVQALMTDVYTPARREKVAEYHWNLISSWLEIPSSPLRLVWPALVRPQKSAIAYDVVIAPFAQHSKIWPVESWHALLKQMRDLGLCVALSATSSHAKAADALLTDFPEVKNLAGASASLNALFEIVLAARSVITVDTGIRHVAAMFGIPCVIIGHGREHRRIMDAYTPTERYLWNAVPCAPCGAEPCPLDHLQCVRGITVDAVMDAFCELVPNLTPPAAVHRG